MPTITLVNNRTVSGAYTSASHAVPSGLTGRVIFATSINSTDLLDTTKSMSFEIDKSTDGGTTWQFEAGFTWVGHTEVGLSGTVDSPSISFPAADIAGTTIRATVNIPKPITLSATVTY